MSAHGIQRKIPARTLQRHTGRAAVDRRVVFLQQAGAAREFGGDIGEITRLALSRHYRLAQGVTLMLPELLDVFRAADAYQLQTFEVGRIRKQDVRHVVGLVARVGHRDHKGKARHGFRQALGIPERDRRIGAVDEPHLGQGHRRQALGGFV